MGFRKEIRSLLRKKRHRNKHTDIIRSGAVIRVDSILEPLSSATTLTPLHRRTTDFFKRQGHKFCHQILTKFNFIDPAEEDGEELHLIPDAGRLDESKQQHNFNDRYTEIKPLAEGGNGQVHLCRDSRLGKLVAVKTIHREYSSEPHEVRVLKALGEHENIVRFRQALDHPTNPKYQKIVFEYCQMGDLEDYAQTFKDRIPEMFIWNVFSQLSNALVLLHQNGIVHGDLKMVNVLVTPPQKFEVWPRLKLADFGTSQIWPARNVPCAHLGTWGCSPPESDTMFGTETDIWALGAIIHVLAIGKQPYHKESIEQGDVGIWFYQNYGALPPGTPYPKYFMQYCYWQARHPCNPRRIDIRTRHAWFQTTCKHSKLLNYFMMRCLDIEWRSRIAAFELHHFLPAIETFVLQITTAGHEDILDKFDDGRGPYWEKIYEMSDYKVLQQVYFAVADRATRWKNPRMMQMVRSLPGFMDAKDYADACRMMGVTYFRPLLH